MATKPGYYVNKIQAIRLPTNVRKPFVLKTVRLSFSCHLSLVYNTKILKLYMKTERFGSSLWTPFPRNKGLPRSSFELSHWIKTSTWSDLFSDVMTQGDKNNFLRRKWSRLRFVNCKSKGIFPTFRCKQLKRKSAILFLKIFVM